MLIRGKEQIDGLGKQPIGSVLTEGVTSQEALAKTQREIGENITTWVAQGNIKGTRKEEVTRVT